MPWLVLAALVLGYALGDRAWTLWLGDPAERDRHAVLVRSITAVAPLVGLLGTVSGMIETFDSLATMSMFRGSGGIAGGISAALVSTQMGLAVAIPGLVFGRLLDRRAARLAEVP
ncbi:MAG: MotA/TolQ/ExbB proton channel family protein [Alphaproteobacteria bacterium]|nr:MotA/TolQ/ExbB proton channel family protein [Alphaproteobacteria bacterium]